MVPPASPFTVTVNGSAVSLADLRPVNVAGNTVRLVLASPVAATDVVTVSYVKPSSGSRLRGAVNEVTGFVGHAVTNQVGAVPAVTGVAITSTPATARTYGHGETIQVTLTYDQAVTVVGAPRLRIGIPEHHREKWARFSTGSGTTKLTFCLHRVGAWTALPWGVAVLRTELDMNGGSIQSAATPRRDAYRWHSGLDHDSNHRVDWRRSTPGVPWVTDVAITSDPGDYHTYGPGDNIQVTLTYDQPVNVTGAPRLKIKMAPNSGENLANYVSGSGTTKLVFSYPVLAGILSFHGVAVLREYSGTERRRYSLHGRRLPVNAHLRHEGLSHNAEHRVDGIGLSLLGVTVNGTKVSVSFNEALDAASVPPASAFTVKRTPQGGSEETVSLSGSPTISGGAAILTLSSAVAATDTDVKVSYTKPTAAGVSRLTDAGGNEAASFTDLAADATDNTPPKLVQGEIDGDVITLYFDEALDETSGGNGDFFRLWFVRHDSRYPDYGLCQSHYSKTTTTVTVGRREMIVKGNIVVLVELGHDIDPRSSPRGKAAVRARVGYRWSSVKYVQSTALGDKILRDPAGNAVSAPDIRRDGKYGYTGWISLNNVTPQPYPMSATVDGNLLTLFFSAPMDEDIRTAGSSFT